MNAPAGISNFRMWFHRWVWSQRKRGAFKVGDWFRLRRGLNWMVDDDWGWMIFHGGRVLEAERIVRGRRAYLVNLDGAGTMPDVPRPPIVFMFEHEMTLSNEVEYHLLTVDLGADYEIITHSELKQRAEQRERKDADRGQPDRRGTLE